MSDLFDAFRLPPDVPVDGLVSPAVGTLPFRYPAPTPELIEATVRSLRAAGRRLAERAVAEIVDVIDAAAARLADPADPLRQRADRLVPAATGYSPELSALVLDRMAADWRAPRLHALLRAELGEPAVLDRFVEVEHGRRTRAYGPRLSFHVFAGNVPGVAVTSLIRSLLVKSPVLGKLASGQPVLPVLFAEALGSVDPAVAEAVAVTYWPGGSAEAEWQALEAADLVVVYGGEDAVASFRDRVPAHDRLVVHGPRFSIGLIGQDALAGDIRALALSVARAVAAFDQHGCVSPHAVWVEVSGPTAARELAAALAEAFEVVEAELPRGQLGAAEAAAIQQERGAAELRGHADGGVLVLSSPGTSWTVVLDEEPVFRPSCLNRFLHVHPVDALADVVDLLAPVGARLQSVAIAGAESEREMLADRLAAIGATRVTTFDRLPWPAPTWHHDGRSPLRELIRWVDLEG